MYSRLAHTLKGYNSKFGSVIPNINESLVRKRKTSERMLARLKTTPPEHMGGWRIEVTVQAATLWEAKEQVEGTGFLNIENWLDPREEVLKRYRQRMVKVSIEDYLKNAEDLLNTAVKKGLFSGRGSSKTTNLQKRAIRDVQNAIGWSGRWRPTNAFHPSPWWKDEQDVNQSKIADMAEKMEKVDLADIFAAVRGRLQCPSDKDHRMAKSVTRGAFWMRCGKCKQSYNTIKSREIMARQTVEGIIPQEMVYDVLDNDPDKVQEVKEPVMPSRGIVLREVPPF
ncbi:unnamed protein product [Sympodiomycopsis kandeliae]